MKILFIGNSHTYVNNVPKLVADMFASEGMKADPVMMTEGGKCLDYHCGREDVNFNILYGNYDAVVLQGRATKFNPDEFILGGKTLFESSLSKVKSRIILYLVWAARDSRDFQPAMTATYRCLAGFMNAEIAPAGEAWHEFLRKGNDDLMLYQDDGNHAKPLGSYLASSALFYTLTGRNEPVVIRDENEPSRRLGLDLALCNRIHALVCAKVSAFRSPQR
jgi:hypothetical protein